MLRSLLYFLKLIIYWLFFFTLYRICFLIIYANKIPDGTLSESLMVFYHSIRLDFATIGHLIFIPFVIWALQQFTKANLLNHINYIYNVILIISITLLCISTIALYDEWNALINYNTLHYLISPAKIFPYLSTIGLIIVSIGAVVVITIFILLFRLLILMVIPYSTEKMIYKIIILPIAFPLLVIMMRGGVTANSINERSACFSKTKFFDHISVNPVWHLSHMTALAIEAYSQPDQEKK